MTMTTATIRRVTDRAALARGVKPWCVAWQSGAMSAPAFWYCDTEVEAEVYATGLRGPQGRKPLERNKRYRANHLQMLKDAAFEAACSGRKATADYLGAKARALAADLA